MKNFFRVLRLVLRYKWTLAASTFTAIMVALLWSVNIGGAYPVFGIITNNQSLQDWVDGEIDKSNANIVKFDGAIHDLEAKLPNANGNEQRRLQHDLSSELRETCR